MKRKSSWRELSMRNFMIIVAVFFSGSRRYGRIPSRNGRAQCALGRMVSRQNGFYWGTAGHTAEPVVAGALGPGAGRFKGYMDNINFGKIVHSLLEGQ